MQAVEYRARRELTANGRRLCWSRLTGNALLDPQVHELSPNPLRAPGRVLPRQPLDAGDVIT
jgi:hypothetical protein